MEKIVILMLVLIINIFAIDKVITYEPSFDCTKIKDKNSIEWIKKRDNCDINKCIEDSYSRRVNYLKKLLPKNNATSPYLIFEIIKDKECKQNNEKIQKLCEALKNRKDIEVVEPIAIGNSLDDKYK